MVREKMEQATLMILLITILTVMVLCCDQNLAAAGEPKLKTHLHKVVLSSAPEGIAPSTLHVKTGHTVVWYNTDTEPVVISFLKELGIVCSPIINFYADLSGAYKTQAIPRGGTASLCFIRQGEYEYKVKRVVQKDKEKPTEHILKGTVIVEEQ